jgi:hypothetical protein
MKLQNKFKHVIFDAKLMIEKGFNPEIFSYYVNVEIKQKDGQTIVFPKCKAVENEGEETLYFYENQTKDKIMIFRASDNPNTKIEKTFLN